MTPRSAEITIHRAGTTTRVQPHPIGEPETAATALADGLNRHAAVRAASHCLPIIILRL